MRDATLDASEEFAAEDDRYRATTATFDAWVTPGDRWRVVVEVPTLDAAVAEESVADVVEDGWFETLERRLADVTGVTRTDDVTPPTVERRAETVVVETAFAPGGDPAAEALALVNFVEGTWFQGVVPGYDYVEEVAAMRESARRRGGE
jgi:hypothetical protein